MTKKGSTEIVNCMTPGTEVLLLMTKEGSTKMVTFMTPRAWVLVLGCGHISHYSENALFF